MIAGLFVTIMIAGIGLLAIVVGIGLFYSGQFVGFPIIIIGIVALVIAGVINIRR